MDVGRNGWPAERRQAPPCICEYWNIRDEISAYDGILYRGERIIVPATLRSDMGSTIEDKVSNCVTCQEARNKQPEEPLLSHDRPARQRSKVALDLFKWDGHDYLLMVDHYSNYRETAKLENTPSKTVIAHVKSNTARYGVVDVLISDNGPQFTSQEFKEGNTSSNIKHRVPRIPRATD